MARGNGIQWLLELDAKLEGAKAMVKELTASEHAAGQADQALKKMEGHTFGGLFKEIFKAGLALKVLEKGAELAWEGMKKLGEAMVDSIQLAAGAERLDKVFANMLGADGGKETLEYMEKFADMSEFTDDAVKNVGAELLRTGLRGADFRNAIAAAADVAANATDKMTAFADAGAALGKAYELGKIDRRLIYALRLPFGEVEQELAKGLGLSQKQIKKQIMEGTLDASKGLDILYDVMERKSGKPIGSLTKGMSREMDAMIAKLKDIPEEMAKNLRTTQGYMDIEESLSNFLDVVAPKLTGTHGVMASLLDRIGAGVKNIDWDHAIDRLQNLLEKAEALAAVLGKAAGYVGKVGGYLEEFGDWIGSKVFKNELLDQEEIDLERNRLANRGARQNAGHWSEVGGRRVFVPPGAPEPMEIGAAPPGAIPIDIAEEEARGLPIMPLPEGMRLNPHEGLPMLPAGLQEAIDKSGQVGDKIGEAVDAGFKERLGVQSPSRVFERHGEMLARGLALGFEAGSARASDASAGMMPLPSLSGVGGQGRGGFTVGDVTVPLTIQVMGGSSSSASEIAQEVSSILPGTLIGALEQAAVQAGVG